jgi:TRAP-type uncharacterized transport system fused permease subunit
LRALSWLERLFFLGVTVLLLWPGLALHGIGIALFAALWFWQKMAASITDEHGGVNRTSPV